MNNYVAVMFLIMCEAKGKFSFSHDNLLLVRRYTTIDTMVGSARCDVKTLFPNTANCVHAPILRQCKKKLVFFFNSSHYPGR